MLDVRRILRYETVERKSRMKHEHTMSIKELGGEFSMIERITRTPRNKDVVVGIGDDCAVIDIGGGKYQLYTVDMLVEDDHFSRRYFTPYDIGYKAMISNVSDIASCGGKVLYGLISFSLNSSIDVPFIDEFYRGIHEVCDRYGFDIIGGDTTHGDKLTVSITLVGETTKENLRLRSMAKPGDLIVTSGRLGGSTAGLRLFLKNIPGYDDIKKAHLHPECGMDDLPLILPIARAMTDVSDGLASEVRNIAKRSGCGAEIFSDKIPLSDGIFECARKLGDNPYDYALYGGEDFALVYTIDPKDAAKITGTIVGTITEGTDVLLDWKKLERFGFDHFA
jgi:thiamine-monophosphate kinase